MMTPINFNETVRSPRFKYLIQTSTNGYSNKIISAVFKDGIQVSTEDFAHGPEVSEDEIEKLTEQIHQRKKGELVLIFNLLPKYQHSTNVKIIELIGRTLLNKNLLEEAINLFQNFIERNTQAASVYHLLGQAYLINKQFEQAIEALKTAVKFQPDYADYRNKLGLALLSHNECSLALEEFKTAISLNVYYAEAYYHSALTYIKNSIVRDDYALSVNMTEKTIKAMEMATRLNPTYKREEYLAGIEALNNDNYQEALKLFLKAEELVTRPDPRQYIHNFYLRLLDEDGGIDIGYIWDYIKELRKIIRKFPTYADLYNDLGIAYTILGTYFQKEATQIFNEALNLNSNYQKAKKNKKLLKYESRGLDYLLDSLLELESDPSRKKPGLSIQFF